MSNPDINKLNPDHIPVRDSSGMPADSPIKRTSTSFLVIGDGVVTPPITALSLTGLTAANASNGVLFAEMDLSYDTVLVIRRLPKVSEYWTEADDLAVADLSDLEGGGGTVSFEGTEHHPLISGTASLSASEEDTSMKLFVPLSSLVPHIVEDEEHNLSDMELRGVNAENSGNGVLEWDVSDVGSGTIRLVLTNPAAADEEVAHALFDGDEYLPFTCDLEALNGSGVTGTAVLESFEPGSGRLVVRVAGAVRLDEQVDMVIPKLKGAGTRAIAVDGDGRIVVL